MNDKELKPCPFCGGFAFTSQQTYPNGKTYWHVNHKNYEKCFLDDCISPDYDTEEEAIGAWNKRTQPYIDEL